MQDYLKLMAENRCVMMQLEKQLPLELSDVWAISVSKCRDSFLLVSFSLSFSFSFHFLLFSCDMTLLLRVHSQSM